MRIKSDARFLAQLRIGEAHHQDEEEHAGEPRRGPEAAHRSAPSRFMIWRGEAHHQGEVEVARKTDKCWRTRGQQPAARENPAACRSIPFLDEHIPRFPHRGA